jgi:hypothetical protein
MRSLRRLLQLLSNSLRPCLVLLCLSSAAFGIVARNDIEVVEVAGGVVQVDDLGVTTLSEAGAKIRRKAKISVGAEGRLVLALSNGARVLVGANSRFVVQAFVDSPSKGSLVDFRPVFGRFTFALPRQGPGDIFVVRSSEGDQHLKTRGLYQLNIVQGSAAQQFVCLAGEVLFTPAVASSGPVRLKTGEQLKLASSADVLTTSIEPMNAAGRRAIVEQLAYEREFTVYPLEQNPTSSEVSKAAGGGSTAPLSAVLARNEDVVERQTQTNPSPTGG